ncbi:MAG: tRNA uridine(34) 5-carboxymethylaminomethyl modification radical SAM/GNAT enzyme Elp3, partial [Candidatus Micrarchaeota archaeon]
GGEEVFLSFEAKNLLYGFCRLRKPFAPFVKEIDENTCGVRELHVYGDEVQIRKKGTTAEKDKLHQQHHGLGKILLEEAERISREEFDAKKLLVISGVGAKEYYYKIGYEKFGSYVGKKL